MKKLFFILALIITSSCDYREYPQEQEYQEDIKEMNEDKQKDPRHYDEVQEQELDLREAEANETGSASIEHQ